MKKLCIILVATNYYFSLGIRFINRWSYFYEGEMDVEFLFYSDQDPSEYIDNSKCNVIYKEVNGLSWKDSDILRLTEIANMDSYDCDYIYIFDADTNIESTIKDEYFISDLAAYEHNTHIFVSNKTSAAFIPATVNDIYYQTCLIGGTKEKMINLCKECMPWLNLDIENGWTPTFISEAYFNKFLYFNKPSFSIKHNSINCFKMSDKGSGGLFMGKDKRPFYNLNNEEYMDMLKMLKDNKNSLLNIVNSKVVY